MSAVLVERFDDTGAMARAHSTCAAAYGTLIAAIQKIISTTWLDDL